MDRFSFVFVVFGLLAALVRCEDAINNSCFETFDTQDPTVGFQLKTECKNASITLEWNTENDLFLRFDTSDEKITTFNITVGECVLDYRIGWDKKSDWELSSIAGKVTGVNSLKLHKNRKLLTWNNREVGCDGKNLSTNIGDGWARTTIHVDASEKEDNLLVLVYVEASDGISKYDPSQTTSLAPSTSTAVQTTTSLSPAESSTVPSTTFQTTESTEDSTTLKTILSTTPLTTPPTSVSIIVLATTTEATTLRSTKLTARVTEMTTGQTPALESSSQVSPVAPLPIKKKKSNLGVVVGALAGVIILLLFGLGLSGAWCLYRRNKHERQREEAETAQRNARRIADYQAQQKQKKQKSAEFRGKVIPGLPPPGPVGYEPDRISARQFKHMGPLKMEQKPPVIMVHELNDDETANLAADQHIVWDDQENLVFDIGSDVEQVYHKGKKIAQPKRAPKAPARRTGEARNLKAIRED